MKTAFSCLLAILCPFFNVFCQPAIHPLTVGDVVPEFHIRNLVQYKTPTARLSDFKDKLLILDFMATSCSSCMYNLSHMDSLQLAYKDQLQILPVSYEPKAKLLSVLQKRSAAKKITSPFATGDIVLKSWFPHQFVSHMVWIHNGIVKAITKPEYVKAANIEAVLRNDVIRWPVKKDVGRYDPAYPLLSANSEVVLPANQPTLRYNSVMPSFMEGFAAGVSTFTDSAAAVSRFTVINHSILQLYLSALGKSLHFPAPQIVLETKDSSRFFYNGTGYKADWYRNNGYCYQANLPLHTPDAMKQKKILADLDFYLGLHGRMELRKTRCIVLRRDSSITSETNPAGKKIEISGIAVELNTIYGGLPCIDEVPESNTIYIAQPENFTDMPALSQLLLRFGVRLSIEERVMEMLVISDSPASP